MHLKPDRLGLPRWLRGKGSVCQCRRHRRHGLDPCFGKISWLRKWQPTPVFLPGKSHGQRSLAGYSPWGRKESHTIEELSTKICWTTNLQDNPTAPLAPHSAQCSHPATCDVSRQRSTSAFMSHKKPATPKSSSPASPHVFAAQQGCRQEVKCQSPPIPPRNSPVMTFPWL